MAKKILLVEDEEAIADTVRYALSTEDFEVIWCRTAEAGLAAAAGGDVNLVVLDIGLPDQCGIEVCRKIREHSKLPVIFLTARGDEIDRVVGLEIGADDYVVKPFSPRELTARIRAVLRRTSETAGGEPPVKAAGLPFRVDPARHQIYYFEQLLNLSRYEFRVLETLLSHPGWVFSREKLMQIIWDAPEASMERTIDTHIKTMRAEMKRVRPDLDPIVTHRGVGYSLRESW